jgi:hypothetical protein
MINLSEETKIFLSKYVFEQMGIDSLTDDNMEDVVEFISFKYEDPLSNAASLGAIIDEELLKAASKAITEITANW